MVFTKPEKVASECQFCVNVLKMYARMWFFIYLCSSTIIGST